MKEQEQQLKGQANQQLAQLQAKYESISNKVKSFEQNERTLTSKFSEYLVQISELNEQLALFKNHKYETDTLIVTQRQKISEIAA